MPSAGMLMSTTSGNIIWMAGRKSRSVALPKKKSSDGGRPTMVVG